ncbi:NADPH-dependent FMN reductase [Streptomyces sp. BI20]|uniref:NADPH-dependent FMN reductase n=1 Tax=Streptomyces sp. BI20 TaxID=3403460 RepID=UPI003C772229
MSYREKLRLVVIIGSVRKGRFGPTAAEWMARRAERHPAFDVDVIDLAAAWLPDVMSAAPEEVKPQAVQDLEPWLAAADAFVVVTPEYNHSYPASLKNAIDWYDAEWHAKPVAFLSYGGASGGLLAVGHLRQVFAECHAVTVRETVSLQDYLERRVAGGHLDDDPAHVRDADRMLDRLAWWGRALRAARRRDPFNVN